VDRSGCAKHGLHEKTVHSPEQRRKRPHRIEQRLSKHRRNHRRSVIAYEALVSNPIASICLIKKDTTKDKSSNKRGEAHSRCFDDDIFYQTLQCL